MDNYLKAKQRVIRMLGNKNISDYEIIDYLEKETIEEKKNKYISG